MTYPPDGIIDSHVHLCLLARHNPGRIPWLINHHCSVISWAFGGAIHTVSDLRSYLSKRISIFSELRSAGLDCYHLVGIHPRKIPPDLTPESVADLLRPYLDSPECLGIGEIGLEADTSREREILCAQLEVGLATGLPEIRFGIHTPRNQKEAVTKQLLSLLSSYETLPSKAVIDHCTPGTIGRVLSEGYHAGISLSPSKTSEGELKEMLSRFGQEVHRIMCNTDSSREFYEDLVSASHAEKIERRTAESIFYGTAARFFGIQNKG